MTRQGYPDAEEALEYMERESVVGFNDKDRYEMLKLTKEKNAGK